MTYEIYPYFTLLNNNLGGIEFSLNENGKGQYRAVGADTWIPFKLNLNPMLSDSSVIVRDGSKGFVTTSENTLVVIFSGGGNGGIIYPSVTTDCDNAVVSEIYKYTNRGTDMSLNMTIGCLICSVNAPIGTNITAKQSGYMYGIYSGFVFLSY